MATQIHGFGPNGELSPGAAAALAGLGGGGGGGVGVTDIYVDADYTGDTDSAAILQAACDLGSSTGKRVVMGPGTIRVDTSITPSSNLHLVGQGPGQTVILTPLNSAAFHRADGVVQENVTFEHFEIDGSRQALPWTVGQKGLFFTHIRRVHLNNIYVHDTGATGIGIDHITGTIVNTVVEGCGRLAGLLTPGSSGIGIGTGRLAEWEPLTISGCHTSGNKRYGIFVEQQTNATWMAGGITITGCTSIGNKDGFGDSGCTGTRFVNCHAIDNIQAGFAIDDGTYSAGTPGRSAAILGSFASGNQYGVLLTGTDADHIIDAARIADNTIIGNTSDGIHIDVTSPAACTRLVIQDNSIYDNGGYGILSGGSGTFDHVSIVGNSFDGNTSGDIRIGGTVTDLLATANDVRSGGGLVVVEPLGDSVTTGNFGTFDVAPTDETDPTPGTLAASAITSTSFTLTVTGASDETALHSQPYAFSTDNGTTWTAWQTSPSRTMTELDPETEYDCQHKVRDAALNEATGTAIEVTTKAAPEGAFLGSASTVDNETVYTFAAQPLGDAAAERHIAVAFATRSGTTDRAVVGMTVAGQTASFDFVNHENNLLAIGVAAVPTGTTGDVVITLSAGGGTRAIIGLYHFVGTPTVTYANAVGASAAAGPLTIASGGLGIAVASNLYSAPNPTHPTFTAGVTTDHDELVEDLMSTIFGSTTTPGSTSATISGISTTGVLFAALAP